MKADKKLLRTQSKVLAELIQEAQHAWAKGNRAAFDRAMGQALEVAHEDTGLPTLLKAATIAYPSENTARLLSYAVPRVDWARSEPLRPR